MEFLILFQNGGRKVGAGERVREELRLQTDTAVVTQMSANFSDKIFRQIGSIDLHAGPVGLHGHFNTAFIAPQPCCVVPGKAVVVVITVGQFELFIIARDIRADFLLFSEIERSSFY